MWKEKKGWEGGGIFCQPTKLAERTEFGSLSCVDQAGVRRRTGIVRMFAHRVIAEYASDLDLYCTLEDSL